MATENEKLQDVATDEVEELDEEALAGIAGGGLRDKVYITPTTDISDDTRNKI